MGKEEEAKRRQREREAAYDKAMYDAKVAMAIARYNYLSSGLRRFRA